MDSKNLLQRIVEVDNFPPNIGVFKNESQAGLSMKAMKAAAADDPALAARVKHFLYRTTEELYDYESDPDEYTNLADKPEYSDTLKHLQKLMANARRRAE